MGFMLINWQIPESRWIFTSVHSQSKWTRVDIHEQWRHEWKVEDYLWRCADQWAARVRGPQRIMGFLLSGQTGFSEGSTVVILNGHPCGRVASKRVLIEMVSGQAWWAAILPHPSHFPTSANCNGYSWESLQGSWYKKLEKRFHI